MNDTDNLYKVTSSEDAEYNDFCGFAFQQLIHTPPETLWYYTTGETFAQILESQKIWSTQIACLNDHTEFRHAVNLVREAIRAYNAEGHDDDTRWIANFVDLWLTDDGANNSWFFVMCMSGAEDDLSQWRSYGGGENGVSIGLRTANLKPDTTNYAFLAPVCYIEDTKNGLATDIAKWTIHFFKKGLARRPNADRQAWATSFLAVWREKIIYFAPLLKDKAFEKEAEWRLIVSLHPDEVERVKIQQRQSLISRHLPLSFGEKIPIQSVIIGPCRHKEISRVSVDTYLRAKKYPLDDPDDINPEKVTVRTSDVPFQTP